MPRTRKQTAPARLGRQTPTAAVVLPYTKTFGQDAIDLYNSTGRTAQQWQELLLYDILARNEEDLWVHTKFGYAVPHQTRKIRTCFRLEKGSDFSFSLGTAMKVPVGGAKLRYLVIDRKTITRFGGYDYEVR